MCAAPAGAVTITIRNTDTGVIGFNDPSPRAPVGGNPGTTLGAQRLFLFQYAAKVWGTRLAGTVPIIVSAGFADLGGTATLATLGQASPTTIHRDFLHAPVPSTWFVAALANQIYGSDQNDLSPGSCPVALVSGACPEIRAQFNYRVDDPVVLGSINFYYGLDGKNGSDIDFLTVLLHEFAHGLGFVSLIDNTTGELFFGYSDAFTNKMIDSIISPKQVPAMSNAQRLQAIVDNQHLLSAGANVTAGSGGLSAGKDFAGHVMLFAPTTYIVGSSVSHYDTSVFPNELMEPYYTNPPPRNLALTIALLKDLGWTPLHVAACGDPTDDGKTTASDALLVLKGAVGSADCPDSACNVNFTGGVTASDALIVLKFAVGQSQTLSCPLA
ncbi:MAG TPA: hypothetical protein VGK20_00035 [Candidatus Binatia bacterium]